MLIAQWVPQEGFEVEKQNTLVELSVDRMWLKAKLREHPQLSSAFTSEIPTYVHITYSKEAIVTHLNTEHMLEESFFSNK